MNEIKYRGRIVSQEDIKTIKTVIKNHPDKNRRFISQEVCRVFDWRQPNGQLKDMICRSLLIKLDSLGLIKLPAPRKKHVNLPQKRNKKYDISIDQTPIKTKLKSIQPIILKQVRRTNEEKLCNHLIEKYHYLGYTRPVGEHLKYIAYTNNEIPIAVLIWSSAPWYIGVRDRFIGWSSEKRIKNLYLISNNTRFLILPWVKIPHLASHLLALSRKRVPTDFQKIYNHPVYLIETFVDTEKFLGTCYIADNWIYLGTTTGRGKLSKSKKPVLSKKKVFVYPLDKDFKLKLRE